MARYTLQTPPWVVHASRLGQNTGAWSWSWFFNREVEAAVIILCFDTWKWYWKINKHVGNLDYIDYSLFEAKQYYSVFICGW